MKRSLVALGLLTLAISCAVATDAPPPASSSTEVANASVALRVEAGSGAFLDAQRCALCHSRSPRARDDDTQRR